MKRLLLILASLSLTFLFLLPVSSFAKDTDPHKTGLIELTPEELAIEVKTRPKIKKVHLNSIGLARVNEHRKKQGLPVLDIQSFPLGQEIETIIGEDNPQTALDTAIDEITPDMMPSSVDNSALKYFPPIRSQGWLGSCASFAGTYYTMTYMYALANNLDAKNGGDAYRFSPKWTYNMVNGGSDSGSSYVQSYMIGINNGAATWTEFPYDGSDYRAWCLVPQVWQNSLSHRIETYGYIANPGQDTAITQVKQMLVNGYILNFSTYMYSWQYKSLGNDPATSADDPYAGKTCCYYINGASGAHAMTVVGYNDDVWDDINNNAVVDPGEKGAFLIANSWGTEWGNAGFVWLAYDAVRDTSAVSGWDTTTRTGSAWSRNNIYWVTAKAGYSPNMVAEFTVNHLKRNQMRMFLGTSIPTRTTPSATFYTNMLSLQGGPYAFNGSTTAVDGTFFFDFTNLLPDSSAAQKYYMGAYDSVSGDPLTLKAYQIINLTTNPPTQVTADDFPQAVDNGKIYSSVTYQYGTDNILPVAVISAEPTSGYSLLTVSFSGVGSYDPDGSIVSYAWDFGDGTSATGANVAHTYGSYGNFTAQLTVTDNMSGTSTDSITINIQNGNPIAVITGTPTSGKAPLTVSFSSANSSDPQGTITGFAWTFGDGAASNLENPTYTYSNLGSYIAVLTVTDDRGLTGTGSLTITVTDPNQIISPSGLTATTSGNTVRLSWQDNSDNEEGFCIQRGIRAKGGITYSNAGTSKVEPNVTTFTDTVANGAYYYRVQAFNLTTDRVSGYSNTVQVQLKTTGKR